MVETAGATRVRIPIHLRWGDLDALGHVNNTSMLKLLEEARLRAFWKPEAGLSGPPTAILDALSLSAETMTGYRGATAHALTEERLVDAMERLHPL